MPTKKKKEVEKKPEVKKASGLKEIKVSAEELASLQAEGKLVGYKGNGIAIVKEED